MIEEIAAVEIAKAFLRTERIEVQGFREARYMPEEGVWACVFTRLLQNAAESPSVTIVDVDSLTGEPTFFETM